MRKKTICAIFTAMMLWMLGVCVQAEETPVYEMTVEGNSVTVCVNGTMTQSEYQEMLGALPSSYSSGLITVQENAVLNPGTVSVTMEVENYGTIKSGTYEENVDNYGSITGGKLKTLTNHGSVTGGVITDLYNAADGDVSGHRYRDEDGDYHYSIFLNGSVTNYGTINGNYTAYNYTKLLHNEGTLYVYVNRNVWRWDEGYGWEYSEGFYPLASSGTVRDTLGEGWHTTTGEYAGDMQMGIYNDLRRQWSKSDGVLTVKADGSAAIPDSVLADVNAIVVQMGLVSFGTVDVPVTITRTYCDSNTYYEPTITGGIFHGGVTIEESGHLKNCTLNSDVIMHAAGSVDGTNTFGGNAKIVIDKALARSSNLWAYCSFPYTYDAPVEIASTGSVACCTFNGPVTNYGVITNTGTTYVPKFNASVTNCGTISGGTFNGGITGSGTLEVLMVVDVPTLCAGESVRVSRAYPLKTIANAAYQWHYATAQDATGSAMDGASSDTFTNDTGLGGYVYPVLIVDEVQVEGPRVALIVSGSCGENVDWKITGDALTVSGTGAMVDCASPADVPWAASRNCVVTAAVEEGVTRIGENAFAEHQQLASISLPISLTGIADTAFDGCPDGMTVSCHADSVAAAFAQANSYTADIEPHDGQAVSGTPASCTEDGLTDGITCKICGFVIQAQEPIPAPGHTSVTDDAVAPGCASNGLTAGSHCKVCGEVLVAQEEIPALGHTSVTDDAVEPTDRETGLTKGSHCGVCGEVLVVQAVIPSNFSWDGDVVTGYNAGKTDVVIPSDAIALGDTAFKGNTNITSVTVPESVRSIGEETFSGCTSLKDVYLPDNLESIGSHAFDGVDAVIHVRPGSATAILLSRVSVPFTTDDSYTLLYRLSDDTSLPVAVILVRYIGDGTALSVPEAFDGLPVDEICARAFADNTALVSVTLPAGVTTIGVRAFAGCTALTSVSLPAGLTAIPGGLFEGCIKLTNARIPESVTSIGSYAYSGCTKISGITLPSALESIGKNAFSGCTRLSSITIPDSVAILDTGAFSGCTRLSSVTLSANLTEIADGVFSGCTVLNGLTLPQSVASIGNRAFYMCEALTEIIIPDGVMAIGANAFSGCTALFSVVMPKNLTTLGDEAFSYCSALSQLVLPDHIATVGTELLKNASTTLYCYEDTLTAQTLTDSGYAYSPIVTIERVEKADGTFDVIATGCADFVVDLIIPEGVTKIGNDAFWGCQAIRSVSLPSTLVSIGESAFFSCESLTSIAIPDGVTTIGASAFNSCTSLESAVLPENLYDIHPYTFFCCGALTAISIPEGVETIGESAFSNCTALASASIPESVVEIGDNAFDNCTSLASVTIPKGVTQIGSSVFYGCTSLASVTIPEGVAQIGDSAFYRCTSLTSVTIPESVTSIAQFAFYACRAMEHVKLPANITELGSDCFNDGITEMKVLYAPSYDCVTALTLTKNGYAYRLDDHAGLHFKSTADEEGVITCTLIDADETITEAVIPDFVSAIADKAFMSCSSLKLVTIPESVTRLGAHVFLECRALERVNLPANITFISYDCFWNAYPAIYLPTYDCQSALSLHAAGRMTYRLEGHDGMIFEGDAQEDGTIICMLTGVDDALTEVTIPDFVTRVDGAFSGYTSLTSVTIPESVTTIGNNAFSGCTSLASITIPESVTTIGEYAFSNCPLLERVDLPANITEMGDAVADGIRVLYVPAYDCATALTLTARGYVYRIDSCAGLYFTSTADEDDVITCALVDADETITEAVIPDFVTGIGAYAFSACASLTSITIPESVTAIGAYAFGDCTSLASITIPESVTEIGTGAFAYCDALERVELPANITEMGDAFAGGIRALYVPAYDCATALTLTARGYVYRIEGCAGLYFTSTADEEGVVTCALVDADETIAEAVIPDCVSAIEHDAFNGCTSLTSVTIPESVTSIGNDAFSRCSGLTSVTIPKNVTTIGSGAFYGCMSLQSVTIPESVTSIGSGAFGSCDALARVDLPANITEMGDAFAGGIRMLYVPAYDCATALTLTARGYVYRIDSCAGLYFQSTADEDDVITCALVDADDTITEAMIPDFVTSIGEYAFSNCTSLTSITIPESVTTIHEYAFYYCPLLERVDLPANVKEMGHGCFDDTIKALHVSAYDCQTALAMTQIGLSFTLDGYAGLHFTSTAQEDGVIACTLAKADAEITEAVIPNFVTGIGAYAFNACASLTSVTVPEGVTSIGGFAFQSCTTLASVTIPESVTAIGEYAFADCLSLASIVLPSGITQLSENTFVNWFGNLTCHCGSVTASTLETLGIRYIPNHHTQVRIPGVPATHRTSGLTEGAYCSACGETLVAQEVIPVLDLPVTTMPSSLRALEEEAFASVPVQIVELAEGCQSIGSRAFADCALLRVVRIPASVTSISDDAFSGCASDLVILTVQGSAAQAFAERLGMLCVLE